MRYTLALDISRHGRPLHSTEINPTGALITLCRHRATSMGYTFGSAMHCPMVMPGVARD
jgi:hypothetical protein